VKIKIDRAALLPLLADCAEVSNDKSPFPYATCVIIETTPDGLRCRATNVLQSIVRIAHGVTVAKEGAIMVHAKDALKRVQDLGAEEIHIEEQAGRVVFSQPGARYVLPKYDIETAPPLTTIEPQGGEIGASAFSALLTRVSRAMGNDESKPMQYGVCIEAKGNGKLMAKATNGAGGALAPMTFDGTLLAMIPAPAVGHLKNVLSKIDGAAHLAVIGTGLHVFADGFAYSTLTADTVFPPLERAFPPLVGNSIMIDRLAALAAIKHVGIDDACAEGLRFRMVDGGIMFYGRNKTGASGSRVVACDGSIGATRFVDKYVSQLLEFSTKPTVTLWLTDGSRTLKGASEPLTVEEDDGAKFTVMPLRYDEIDLMTTPPDWT
jgi:DNA polymerase III sliding clamp (beta) subunit (PCNA family)